MANIDDLSHDDFIVLRRDGRFGGFEELGLKSENPAAKVSHSAPMVKFILPRLVLNVSQSNGGVKVRYFRKSVMPGDHAEFENA